MTLATGVILHNRYRIVKLVGQGGFGAVYRAWDTALDRPVAVKENFDTGPQAQRQFEREAKLLAGLRHPNLPVVTDHFISLASEFFLCATNRDDVGDARLLSPSRKARRSLLVVNCQEIVVGNLRLGKDCA